MILKAELFSKLNKKFNFLFQHFNSPRNTRKTKGDLSPFPRLPSADDEEAVDDEPSRTH